MLSQSLKRFGRPCRGRLMVSVTVVFAALAIGACGKTSATSSSASTSSTSAAASTGAAVTTSASASTSATASSGCGSVPTLPYHDASGVLAALGSTYTSQFNGYPTPIYKSAWANFKASGRGPYTIGVAVTQPVSPLQAVLIPLLEHELKAIKGVAKVTVLTSSPSGVTQQIQQADSLIQQHVTVLVAEPIAAPAFIGVAAKAKAAGIPMISIVNSTPTADSINISPDSVADAATAGAELAKLIGGKGLVIGIHGIPGTGVDTESFTGYKAAFAHCPGIKLDASITGEFQPTVAKQAVLSYLSSHPQPIAGVVQTAGMGSGIIQAFEQTGRPIPVMVDSGPTVGDLVFWKSHPGKLASAFTITPQGTAHATADTVGQLLAGHGPKISELSQLSLAINSSNLDHFITPGAKVSDEQFISGPWLPDSYLAPLFNK